MSLFNLQEFEKQKNTPAPETSREGKKRLDELVYVLTDPIVLHRSPWADTLPEWVRGQIIIERMVALIKGEPGMATDAEAMAYIYPASFDAPLDHDWSEIYLYVSTRTMESAGKTVPPDVRVDKLDSYKMGLLNHLKRWIYERRVKNRQKTAREDGHPAKAPEYRRGKMEATALKKRGPTLAPDITSLFAEM